MSKICSVENCDCKHYAKGYCQKHYTQFRKYGHVLERTRFDVNEIIEYDDYAEIVLYDKDNNEVARAMIDLEYVDVVKDYKWYSKSEGYVCNSKIGYLHQFIMNPSEGMVVDHINRNPLDNRRENLRICTQHENTMNKSIRCSNTSGVSGVNWSKQNNKWLARIQVDGKHIYLGYYNTLEEAAEVRRQAEIEYFGEFSPNNN